jgi:hypothetical protein
MTMLISLSTVWGRLPWRSSAAGRPSAALSSSSSGSADAESAPVLPADGANSNRRAGTATLLVRAPKLERRLAGRQL